MKDKDVMGYNNIPLMEKGSEQIWAVELLFNYFIYKVGEDNGTPLQYSCLENPMDGGAW